MPRCNICGSTDFEDFNGRIKVMCRQCHSLERHRSFRAALESCGWLTDARGRQARILHLAPEQCTHDYMSAWYPCYMAADASPSYYPHAKCLKLFLPEGFGIFPDGYFDLIIHNHVLEHIPGDYRDHMREFARLLAPGGQMIFTLPVGLQRDTVQGGERMATDAMRIAAFGQRDHYKSFGQDFLQIFPELGGSFHLYRVPEELEREIGAGNGVFCFTKGSPSP